MIELQFPWSRPHCSKTMKFRAFYKFIKAKVNFQRERESTCVQVKRGPASLYNYFYIPMLDTLFAWGIGYTEVG